MTNQSPAEGLRQQLIKKYMEVASSFYFEGSYETVEREKYAPEFADEVMELVTAYAATVEREALERLKGWIDRNHYQPVNESDRWVQASGEIMQEIDASLAALQGPQDQTDDGIDYGGGSRG